MHLDRLSNTIFPRPPRQPVSNARPVRSARDPGARGTMSLPSHDPLVFSPCRVPLDSPSRS